MSTTLRAPTLGPRRLRRRTPPPATALSVCLSWAYLHATPSLTALSALRSPTSTPPSVPTCPRTCRRHFPPRTSHLADNVITPLDKWCHKASMHKGKIDISVHAPMGNPIINVTDAELHSRSNASRSSDRYPFLYTTTGKIPIVIAIMLILRGPICEKFNYSYETLNLVY